MPITLTPLSDGKGIIVKGHGHVSDEEYREFISDKLLKLPENYAGGTFCFHDYSEVESVDVEAKTISETGLKAAELFEKHPDIQMAVAAPTDLIFGLARMWTAWLGTESANARLFRDSDTARQWLREEYYSDRVAV